LIIVLPRMAWACVPPPPIPPHTPPYPHPQLGSNVGGQGGGGTVCLCKANPRPCL
jgi:hypothetical protein